MPLNIRGEEVSVLAEQLTTRKHMTKTDAVKLALVNELHRLDEASPSRVRVRPIQVRGMARPPTGLEADKRYYDRLSGET